MSHQPWRAGAGAVQADGVTYTDVVEAAAGAGVVAEGRFVRRVASTTAAELFGPDETSSTDDADLLAARRLRPVEVWELRIDNTLKGQAGSSKVLILLGGHGSLGADSVARAAARSGRRKRRAAAAGDSGKLTRPGRKEMQKTVSFWPDLGRLFGGGCHRLPIRSSPPSSIFCVPPDLMSDDSGGRARPWPAGPLPASR
jgi:hypothetical protein